MYDIKCPASQVDEKIKQLKDAARKFNDQMTLNPKSYDVTGCGDSYNCHEVVKELLNKCGLKPPDRSTLPKPSHTPTFGGASLPANTIDPYIGLY